MEISAMSASAQSVGGSVFKGAMESAANSVLTLLGDMPTPTLPPSSGRMDIRV